MIADTVNQLSWPFTIELPSLCKVIIWGKNALVDDCDGKPFSYPLFCLKSPSVNSGEIANFNKQGFQMER